ncbi:hypothetical protein GYMLUDRAFT_42643 [Collybiopsis luxurians FD-317 M1]|uniref:Uncharacterized protein n=1 Tax=Collybiopsis luxurians FD-317 M1 TaxID=944289 RepID=A0A0D0C0A1_9AGAR|nr:hypothetical protein GYMLUDRAFT_42643 [Collybiopsis luxurians FD-317 M1]
MRGRFARLKSLLVRRISRYQKKSKGGTQADRTRSASKEKSVSSRMGFLINLDNGPLPDVPLLKPLSTSGRTFVKLESNKSVFTLSIPLPVQYDALLERIDKKLRNCGIWRSNEGRSIFAREITYTTAEGQVVVVGPESPFESMFEEENMVSLRVQ